MQVRPLFAAVLLAVTAAGASAQEIDPRDQQAAAIQSTRSRESVRAEVRNLQAVGALRTVGENAAAPVTGASVDVRSAEAPKTREQVKADLKTWRASHQAKVGELG